MFLVELVIVSTHFENVLEGFIVISGDKWCYFQISQKQLCPRLWSIHAILRGWYIYRLTSSNSYFCMIFSILFLDYIVNSTSNYHLIFSDLEKITLGHFLSEFLKTDVFKQLLEVAYWPFKHFPTYTTQYPPFPFFSLIIFDIPWLKAVKTITRWKNNKQFKGK